VKTWRVTLNLLAPELGQTLAGVFALDGNAFIKGAAYHDGLVAVLIVLIAGFSGAVGQSIVLFANRVQPARFFFSLLVDAVLFTFGYAFLVLSTWVVCRLPGTPHFSFRTLALVFGLSYAPLLFSFLCALPYLGSGLLRVLRIWHLLAMVVGVAAVGSVNVFVASTYVLLGWFVMTFAQRSFGKPIANLGVKLLDAVAGVRVIDDASIEIGTVSVGGRNHAHTERVAVQPKGAQHPGLWLTVVGLGAIVLLTLIVALALDPVRNAVFGWQEHLPVVLRLPFDLLWLVFIAFIVSAFMAPFETLGWWAGWFGDKIDTSDEGNPPNESALSAGFSRYIVYLDGIAQSSGKYTPDVETFLDALAPELPSNVCLVRGVMSYSVLNKPLDDDPVLAPMWKFIEASRSRNLNSLLGMIINLRNVLIVAVSADPRYGPMYNFGMARVIYKSIIANGYKKKSGISVTLLGYSGGGQMACGSATFLKRALDAPVDVISLGGVMSGNDPILDLEHLFHFVGDKDNVERIGPVMFASRWKIAALSYWNRAKRLGALTQTSLGPVGHQVPGGMMDPDAKLPDGRTFLRQTLDYVVGIIEGRVEPEPAIPKKTSNYARYAAAAPVWSIDAPDPARYLPVADWIGRLILPQRDARFGGALFEVHHAPDAQAGLVGKTVKLCWAADPNLKDRLRAVTRDVNFSAEATHASIYGGLVMPDRLNRWRMVDPLESLAGSHPSDDIVVKLDGPVALEGRGIDTTLRIAVEPVQITGERYGLVTFLGPAETAGDYRVAHFDRASGAFSGAEEIVHMPPVVPDGEGHANSAPAGIEHSPLNAEGWYVYGALGARGTFLVQSLAPRALLRARARRPLENARDSRRYANKQGWRDLVTAKGDIIAAGSKPWNAGDRGLLAHTYGGVGGKKPERSVVGPFYFGHFAYGLVEAVDDPLSGELRFEITYYQVYTQNTDGLSAGKLHWSRYMGDLQFGWAGIRPVCEAILRLDAFAAPFDIGDDRRASALDAFMLQLEAMTARYRIGDGTGGTFVTAAHNCSQDSDLALFATLRAIDDFIKTHPARDQWALEHPDQVDRYNSLLALLHDLRKQLQPFGNPRQDWSQNEYNLGGTAEDAPIQNFISGIGSWRSILPRLAFNTIVDTFLRHDATAWVIGTNQIGGDRPDISPVVPFNPLSS
jgi:hypothetical protein